MDERHADRPSPTAGELLATALAQLAEDAREYNAAIASYNTHLDNHRERRDLHDLPFRERITAHPAFDAALTGDPDAIEALLAELLDRAHLDSAVRRHPRAFAIHLEAVEHLEIAREQLVRTLEEALQHLAAVG